MDSTPHLLFNLHGLPCALEAHAIREIIWLPELTPLAETPLYIAGVINFRGQTVPVIDLNTRLGRIPPPYTPSDNVIIVDSQGKLVGLVANEVQEICVIPADNVELPPAHGPGEEAHGNFVTGVINFGGKLYTLLHLENITRLDNVLEQPDLEANAPAAPSDWTFCPEATPEERLIFRERAEALIDPTGAQEPAGRMPVAVIDLSGERYGIGLESIRGFCDIRDVARVPCCPSHIIGVMNLRGEILPLVDIRRALRIPINPSYSHGQVVIAEVDGLRTGILVDQVFEVAYVDSREVVPVPPTLQGGGEYLHGTTSLSGHVLSILDLSKLLSDGGFITEDDV